MNHFKKFKNTKIVFFVMVSYFLILPVFSTSAYEIRDTSTEIRDDFVLDPAKLEVFLDPGGSQTEFLNILNRTDKTLEFNIEIEDFSGSKDPDRTVILSGEERGPYSLRDYIYPEIDSFKLEPGQKITFPIEIKIPLDAEPGGLYGSVLVSSAAEVKDQTGSTVVSRLGALFFVNVNGEVIKDGKLTSLEKIDSEEGISFDLLFENNGTSHLNPYGFIKVYNIMGSEIAEIEVDSYFAMPDSVRLRNIKWGNPKLFGRYEAVATINRDYDDKVDEMTITFWVVSVKMLATAIGLIILITLIIIWLVRNFDFNITKDKDKDKDNGSDGQASQGESIKGTSSVNQASTPPVQQPQEYLQENSNL